MTKVSTLLICYTNELAAEHSMHEVRTDEFTVETLYELYDEIMSQKVEPSTGTGLLEVHFDGYINMVDPDGNIVDDSYQGTSQDSNGNSDGEEGTDSSSSDESSSDGSDYDDSDYDDSSYDDSGYDNSSYDDSSYDDSSYDDSGYDDSSYDDSGYDDSGY